MGRNVKIFRQLGQIFEPFCVMFRELKRKKRSSPCQVSEKKRRAKICAKINKTFSSGLSVFRGLSKVYLGLRAKCRIFAHF